MAPALAWLASAAFWKGVGVGLFGGGVSGLLGVSSGGILVPALAVALALDQHRAQGVSLAAQVLPTSLPGVVQYVRKGHGVPWPWIAWASLGFLVGAYAGALGAGALADAPLRWLYVGYLVVLGAVTWLRGSAPATDAVPVLPRFGAEGMAALAGIGFAGGASSGLLGIGGGLAMTALAVGMLGLPQHASHAISLAVTMLPLGLPAVWVYLRLDEALPWPVVGGVVLGLVIGTMVGARFATAMEGRRLRGWFLALIALMAVVIAAKALGW